MKKKIIIRNMAAEYVLIPCGDTIVCRNIVSVIKKPCVNCDVIVDNMSPNPELLEAVTKLKKSHRVKMEQDIPETTSKYLDDVEASLLQCIKNERSVQSDSDKLFQYLRNIPSLISEQTNYIQTVLNNIKQIHNDTFQADLFQIFEHFKVNSTQ
jgi:hypothetical protein